MALTDLTGTVWLMDNPVNLLSSSTQFNLVIQWCEYTSVGGIIIDTNAIQIIYEGPRGLTTTYICANKQWVSHTGYTEEQRRTITVISGNDSTNSTLISWFQANGVWVNKPTNLRLSYKSDYEDVADAIRIKGGTSAKLTWPEGFITAVQNIPTGGVNNQNKTVSPSESQQAITADTGYTGLGTVTVNAISSTYVGSGISRKSSTDLTVSGDTITVPAGYYASQASKSVASMTLPTSTAASATSGYTSKATVSRSTSDQYINIPVGYNFAGAYYKISAVANGSVTAPSTISGTSASVSTGTNTLTLSKTISVTPSVTTAGYISSGTAGNASVSLTASVTTKAAATITPGTSNQTINSGTYLTGIQTIAGDADLVGSNIISTANIFGVQGTVVLQNYYTGSSAPSSSLGSDGDLYLQS